MRVLSLLLIGIATKATYANHNPNSNQCVDIDPVCALFQEIRDDGNVS